MVKCDVGYPLTLTSFCVLQDLGMQLSSYYLVLNGEGSFDDSSLILSRQLNWHNRPHKD